MKFVRTREFRQDVVKYLNKRSETVVMKRKKPIAWLVQSKGVQQKVSSLRIVLLKCWGW